MMLISIFLATTRVSYCIMYTALTYTMFNLSSGLIMLTLVQDLQQQTGDLSLAIPFNSVVQHVLAPSSTLALQDTLDTPEYVVFLARLYEQAICFRAANINTESSKTHSNGSCERLVKHASTLLHYLSDRVMDVTAQILNTNYFVRNNSAEMDSEMQESEPYHDSSVHNNDTENGTFSSEGQKSRRECSVHLQLFCLYRASLSAVDIYQNSTINTASTSALTLPDSRTIDAQIVQLSTHGLPDHTAHVRAAQCVTISALSLLFDSPTSIAATTNPSTSAAATTTTLPASLNTLLTTTGLLVQDGFTHRTPGCKIAALGLCDFVKYSSLLRPKVCVFVLSFVVFSYMHNAGIGGEIQNRYIPSCVF